MDANFWIGVSVGLVVSFIGSLFANYLTPTLSEFMSRGMASVVERNRKTAMRRYARICELHTEKFDRYFFMLNMWGWTITCWIASAVFQIMALLFLGIHSSSYMPLAYAILFFALGSFVLFKMLLMQSRLSHFDEYKKKLIERWGNID